MIQAELFMSEQLPSDKVLLVAKLKDGRELALALERDCSQQRLWDSFHSMLMVLAQEEKQAA
jgi:hypothetical protein